METLQKIAKKLASINRKCYVVGSFCVHKILEKPFSGDIDLSTDARPEEISQVLNVVGEIGRKYGTLIIKEDGKVFEITTFRKDIGSINHRRPVEVAFTNSLEEDAKRRDFTINAIYYDILSDTFLDPTGGIDDLHKKIIRFVGDIHSRLDEDILRLLRYVRFRFYYGFKPASKQYDSIIKKRVHELTDIAMERIRQEFEKILINEGNIAALRFLKKIKFLEIFLPDVDALSYVSGGPAHHLEGDVWKHTLLTIKAIHPKVITKQKEKELLYWTALLHDIGKARTFSRDANGNVHYFDHERVGSQMIDNIAKKWKMSTVLKDGIIWLIKSHLLPQKLSEMKKIKVYRLMLHPHFPLLLQLTMADGSGKKPKYILPYKKIMQEYFAFQEKYKTTKFYTGDEIMNLYPNITGMEIGKKLEEINNQILVRI